jgi:hypothetical protein
MDAFYVGSCDACEKSLEGCLQAWFEQHLQTDHQAIGEKKALGCLNS